MSEYVTLEEANDYFENSRPDSGEWIVAEDDERQRYLNCGEDIITLAAFRFPEGFLESANQIDQTGRNYRIFRRAIFEETIYIMQTGALRKNPKLMMGIQNASAGPLSVTFNKEFDKPLVPSEVFSMLESIGAIATGANTITSSPILF